MYISSYWYIFLIASLPFIYALYQKPVDEDGRNYTHFISSNLQILCQNLVDDVYLLSIFEVSF